jgi:hypothetical protein
MIDQLIDAVAWAKTCMLIAASTLPSSPERTAELDKLRHGVVEPRRVVDEILGLGQTVPRDLLVELRACELAIPKLEAGAVLRQTDTGAP